MTHPTDIHTLAAHPAANLFPMLNGVELDALAEDIKQRGLIEPVWLYDDSEFGRVVLDGRNRLAACKLAGIKPSTRVYSGDDPIGHIVALNKHRRHLNSGQWAMIALELEAMYAADAQREKAAKASGNRNAAKKTIVADRPQSNDEPAAGVKSTKPARKARDKAASALKGKTSGRAIGRAKRVKKEAPDLAAKVAAGTLSLDAADKQVKKREAEAAQEKAIAKAQELPPAADLRIGDFREVLDDLDGKVDAIITDPPYPHEFIPLLSDLSRVASRILKPGGICAVMMGQTYLPEVYARLTEHLDYHWTLTYLTPGGQAVQVWPRKVNTFWKPIITLTNGPRETDKWLGDVAKSDTNNNDKRFHHWGQSESGMADLVKRLTEPGQLIADPFMGAGTTGVVALALGREFVGCDIDAGMVAKADARTKEAVQ